MTILSRHGHPTPSWTMSWPSHVLSMPSPLPLRCDSQEPAYVRQTSLHFFSLRWTHESHTKKLSLLRFMGNVHVHLHVHFLSRCVSHGPSHYCFNQKSVSFMVGWSFFVFVDLLDATSLLRTLTASYSRNMP